MTAKAIDSQKDDVQPVAVASEPTPMRVMSNEDSLVADLVKEQPSLEQLAQITSTYRKVPDLLAFPEEVLAKHGKEYHFAWLNKNKDLSVKLRTTGWVLCNRTNSPYIKAHRFGGHGAVEQAGMLLAFMPKRMADEMYAQPGRISAERLKYATEGRFKQQDKDAPYQFYKPVDRGGEDD
jgi:hypothetical protein